MPSPLTVSADVDTLMRCEDKRAMRGALGWNRVQLGAVSGEVAIDPTAGAYQDCNLADTTVFGFASNGTEGDELKLTILWSNSGDYDVGMDSGIKLPSLGDVEIPFKHEAWRSSIFTFRFMGGYWCLTDWRGFYLENVD